jgi:hypothetical protein
MRNGTGTPLRALILGLALGVTGTSAHASIDEECVGKTQTFDDQGQQNFLLNFFSLATTFSPLHAPVPGPPGSGGVDIEIAVIPALSCEQRLVLGSTKTEDTNKAPAAPRPRVSFVLPALGKFQPYGSFGYVPPVEVFGTRNVIVSVEAGVGTSLGNGIDLGVRYHATLLKTIAEIATPFEEGDPEYLDFYSGSTFGVDAMVGYPMEGLTPYLAVGVTDVSTFFMIGDDSFVGNNTEPYFGPNFSVGAQKMVGESIDTAAEVYVVPGFITTARLRAGVRF